MHDFLELKFEPNLKLVESSIERIEFSQIKKENVIYHSLSFLLVIRIMFKILNTML